jgi:hypothetical protein
MVLERRPPCHAWCLALTLVTTLVIISTSCMLWSFEGRRVTMESGCTQREEQCLHLEETIRL